MPVAGEVVEINAALEETPEAVNDDPFGEGWFVKIKIADPEQMGSLMDPQAYAAYLESLGATL